MAGTDLPDERDGVTAQEALRAAKITIAQLERALSSRVAIEQAKGYLAAATGVTIPVAFEALRKFCRDRNLVLRQVCIKLVAGELAGRDELLQLARRERLHAAQDRARALVAEGAALLVASRALSEESARLVAHALPYTGVHVATDGMTLCDLAVGTAVMVVPDLRWEDVASDYRCDTCAAALQGAA